MPVGPASVLHAFDGADDVVAVSSPRDFEAVGRYYVDFSPTGDDEVLELLDRVARHRAG